MTNTYSSFFSPKPRIKPPPLAIIDKESNNINKTRAATNQILNPVFHVSVTGEFYVVNGNNTGEIRKFNKLNPRNIKSNYQNIDLNTSLMSPLMTPENINAGQLFDVIPAPYEEVLISSTSGEICSAPSIGENVIINDDSSCNAQKIRALVRFLPQVDNTNVILSVPQVEPKLPPGGHLESPSFSELYY